MKTIIYHPDAEAIADSKAEDLAREFLRSKTMTSISVSTENFILAARCIIYESGMPHDEVEFSFSRFYLINETIKIDVNGRLSHYPKGFCTEYETWLCRLLEPKEHKNGL